MVAAVAVQYIYCVDFVKIMLEGISCEHARNTRVKAASQKACDSCLLETLPVSPLPGIVKISREAKPLASLLVHLSPLRVIRVLALIICCINVGNLGCKAGIHNCQILIRKCYIEYCIRLVAVDKSNYLINMVRVKLCCCYLCTRLCL